MAQQKPVKKRTSAQSTKSNPKSANAKRKPSVRVGSGKKNSGNTVMTALFGGTRKWITLVIFLVVFGSLGAYLVSKSSAATYSTYGCSTLPTLRRGSTGSCVKKLQNVLKYRWGRTITVDGIFGSGTEREVRAFQASHYRVGTGHSLASDGVVGSTTWKHVSEGVTWGTSAGWTSLGRVRAGTSNSGLGSYTGGYAYFNIQACSKPSGSTYYVRIKATKTSFYGTGGTSDGSVSFVELKSTDIGILSVINILNPYSFTSATKTTTRTVSGGTRLHVAGGVTGVSPSDSGTRTDYFYAKSLKVCP